MTELKYTGRTLKPVKYFFSLSCQEVHLNVLLRKNTPTYSNRSSEFKGATDCRFGYTNPIVYLKMANLPCISLELFPALTLVTFHCPLAVSVLLFAKLCCKKDQHNDPS